MKVLLYFENQNLIKQSGIGRALRHQMKALDSVGVEYTLDPKDTYDIAHINTIYKKSYRLLKKCKKNNIPVIVHGHSTVEDFENSFRCWKIARHPFYKSMFKMYSNADYIITPTPYSKGLIEGYKQVTCPVYDVSNGIDLKDYSRDEAKIKRFKEYFNIKDGEKVVIGVGLFFERKGLYDFFECAKMLPDVKFIWFGHLARILTQLKMLKAIKNKPANVIMPGYIDGDIIKGAFQGADLLFFPSYEETEGIVELEGLASKIPTLVRNIGVYKPWLVNNESCYMGNNNAEFVELIKKITSSCNEEMNESIINNGYDVVLKRDTQEIGKKLKNIYEEILSKKENNNG